MTEIEIKKIVSEEGKKNGAKGGNATLQKYGKKHFKKMARIKKAKLVK